MLIHSFTGLFIAILIILRSSAQDADRQAEIQEKFDDVRFKDFLQKFDPRTVWEKVERTTKKNSTDYLNKMFQSLDESGDLLKLNVHRLGTPPIGKQTIKEMIKDARKYKPLAGLNPYSRDEFDLRVRIYELMRQAIYQARNGMVIMQILREKYQSSPLYKMGFLMSKTDNAVKTFYKFGHRAFRLCGLTRAKAIDRNSLYDVLLTEERLLHLWFNAQLLSDLVVRNNNNLTQLLKKEDDRILKKWKFEDK